MIRSLIRCMKGYVKVRVEGYSPERFLNMCSFHGIYIWGLSPVGNAYEMYMTVSGFKKLRPLARKTHTKIFVTRKYGVPFFLIRYRKRRLFFVGAILCMVLLKLYSLFIWDIHFEGNEKWTDAALTEFLASEEVAPFMLKSQVDCQGIVKAIRKEYNDIVWVSASVDGSRLKIQIKENEDTFREEEDTHTKGEQPTDLIASSDGVITDIVTRSGVPQVHVGDEVKKGDILVLGRIEVLDDSGEVTGYQYQQSDADIYADTELWYENSIPLTRKEKVYDGKESRQGFVRIFGWTVSAGSINNKYENSEIHTKEKQAKIGENFYLPFSWGTKTAKSYSWQSEKYTREEIRQKLSADFQLFCSELEEKGVQIKENNVKIQLYENSASASGTLYLNEKITREADTEILNVERKETDESGGTDD